MRRWLLLSTLTLACAATEPERAQPQRTPMPTPPASDPASHPTTNQVSQANLGERVTLIGQAIDRKGGATLVGEGFEVWIVDLHSWPDGYYQGGDRGETLEVTGILDEDHGLPVFVPKDDEPIVQGVPVPEGTDLEAASHRFILRDAKWTPRP